MTLKGLIEKAWTSWATRSLAVGAVATLIDISVLLICVKVAGLPNPVGAMCGVCVGAVFSFFANRHFAFQDRHPEMAPQALKFVLTTTAAMGIHASLVWLLTDHWDIPVVIAKMMADVAVFSVGQLLLLRYVVFPRKAPEDRTTVRGE